MLMDSNLVDICCHPGSDLLWVLGKHKCTEYVFRNAYDKEELIQSILKSFRVCDAISKQEQETGMSRSLILKECESMCREIAHTFDMKTLRFVGYLLRKIVKRLFQHVYVNMDGVKRFEDSIKHTPILLLPTHSSYFDFLLASYMCFSLQLPLPAIAAGQDFLSIVVVNHLLRRCGAFYMRRSFAADLLYRCVFTEYVQRLLHLGDRPIEFFPEGTRSRTGKSLQPKLGLISMVLEMFFHGFVQDISVIPVSISYEQIPEERLYMFELLGIPKPKESLQGLLKSASILSEDFGNVHMHLGEILSLKTYCEGKINRMEYISIPRCERHFKVFGRERFEMHVARQFGEKIIAMQQDETTIYPRSVIAAAILNGHTKPLSLDELGVYVHRAGRLLQALGRRLHGFEGLPRDLHIIRTGVQHSGHVLEVRENSVVCSYQLIADDAIKNTEMFRVMEADVHFVSQALGYIYLSCQRNKLLHLCVLPSFVLMACGCNGGSLTNESCFEKFEFLYGLFQIEFVFDPDSSLSEKYLQTVVQLKSLGLMQDISGCCDVNADKLEDIGILRSLLQPFIDGYWIMSNCILSNPLSFPASFKQLSTDVQMLAAAFIKKCGCQTYEAVQLNTVSNAIASLCKLNNLSTTRNDKYETLVSGVCKEELSATVRKLDEFVSPKILAHALASRAKL